MWVRPPHPSFKCLFDLWHLLWHNNCSGFCMLKPKIWTLLIFVLLLFLPGILCLMKLDTYKSATAVIVIMDEWTHTKKHSLRFYLPTMKTNWLSSVKYQEYSFVLHKHREFGVVLKKESQISHTILLFFPSGAPHQEKGDWLPVPVFWRVCRGVSTTLTACCHTLRPTGDLPAAE